MRCPNCGSEWKSSLNNREQEKECPFCHKPLIIENDSVFETFRWIIETRGLKVFNEPGMINSLLSDLVKGHDTEKKKIKIALTVGAGELFYQSVCSDNIFDVTDREKLIVSMTEFGLSTELSEYIVDLFKYATFGFVPEKQEDEINYADQLVQPGQKNAKNQGVEQDDKKVFEYFLKAAEQGNKVAQANAGQCYRLGRGTEVTHQKAFEYYKKSADQGDADAQTALDTYYRDKKGRYES